MIIGRIIAASGRDFELVEIFAQAGFDAHSFPARVQPGREIIEPRQTIIHGLISSVRSGDLVFQEENRNAVANREAPVGSRIDEELP